MDKQRRRLDKKKSQRSSKSTKANGKQQNASGSSGNNANEASKIQYKRDMFSIENLVGPSALPTFSNEAIISEILYPFKLTEIYYESLCKEAQKSLSKPSLPSLVQYKMPNCLMEFLLSEDVHFQEMLHLSRKTVKAIIINLRGISRTTDEDTPSGSNVPVEPIDKMVYLLLWYLRNKDSSLSDAVKMFELGSVENARQLLDRCIELLMKLKEDSGLVFPTNEEQLITADTILRRYGFPGAAGVMGYQIVKSERGQRLMLQGVCNERYNLVDLHISFDTRPHIAFQLSSLRQQLSKLEKGLAIACNEFSFPLRLRKNLSYPLFDPITGLERRSFKLFNTCHKTTSYMIAQTFKQLLNRFERLKVLETCDQNVVMAACVIYNYANKYNDLTPF